MPTPYEPEVVAQSFVTQFYDKMVKNPSDLHLFYHEESYFTHCEAQLTEAAVPAVQGLEKIKAAIRDKLTGARVDLTEGSVDAQNSDGNSVLIVVTGEFAQPDMEPRKFVQTFFLANQSNGYFVRNSVFRLLDPSPAGSALSHPTGSSSSSSSAGGSNVSVSTQVGEAAPAVIDASTATHPKAAHTPAQKAAPAQAAVAPAPTPAVPAPAPTPAPEARVDQVAPAAVAAVPAASEAAPAAAEEAPAAAAAAAPVVAETPVDAGAAPAPTGDAKAEAAVAAAAVPPPAPVTKSYSEMVKRSYKEMAVATPAPAPAPAPAAPNGAPVPRPAPSSTSPRAATGATGAPLGAAGAAGATPSTTASDAKAGAAAAGPVPPPLPTPPNSLYVKQLPEASTEAEVSEMLTQFGVVKRVELNVVRCFAFVEMDSAASQRAAIVGSAGGALEMRGSVLKVEERRGGNVGGANSSSSREGSGKERVGGRGGGHYGSGPGGNGKGGRIGPHREYPYQNSSEKKKDGSGKVFDGDARKANGHNGSSGGGPPPRREYHAESKPPRDGSAAPASKK